MKEAQPYIVLMVITIGMLIAFLFVLYLEKIEKNKKRNNKQIKNNHNQQKTIVLEKGLELHFDQEQCDKALSIVSWFNQKK